MTLGGVFALGQAQISAATARRICCDTAIAALTHDRGQILDLGRETRFPSAGLRRRLEARDRGCRFPGCTRPATRCHAHHIQHWADGGPTCESNMLLVCARHHHAAHEGGWQLTFDGRTAVWTDPHGRTYDGRAPLADPPRWDDDGPFPHPYQPPPPRRTGPGPDPEPTQGCTPPWARPRPGPRLDPPTAPDPAAPGDTADPGDDPPF